jgi:hypothetical protein
MKLKLLGLVLAAFVLALVAIFGLVLVSPDQRGATADAPAKATSAEDASPAPAAPLETPEAARADVVAAPTDAVPAAIPVEGDRRTSVPEGGRWIEGHVQIPPAAPADESMRVVLLAKPLDADDVHGDDGVLVKLGEESSELLDEVLGVAKVESDGSFRVACPGDASEAWLALDGRFLYLTSVARVDLAASTPTELLPRLGACVRGTIRLPAKAELPTRAYANADIELGIDPAQFTMTGGDPTWWFGRGAHADESGVFEVRAVDCGRPRSLSVASEGFAMATQPVPALAEGELREVEVALGYGATIRGLVLGPDDAPVPGAEVVAARTMIFGFAGGDGPDATSGGDGTFEIAGVAEGTVGLTVEATGFLAPRAKRIDVQEGEVREGVVLRLEAGDVITGLVKTIHGTPVAGAKVSVSFDPAAMMGAGAMNAARGGRGSTESDAAGRFRVGGLGKGPFVVEASAPRPGEADPDDPPGDWRGRKSGVKPGSEVELELVAPLEIEGRVIDAEGAPITAYSLSVRGRSDVVFIPGTSKKVEVSDEGGKFEVGDLAEGTFELQARAKGYGPNEPIVATLARGTAADPIEILLRPEAGVTGWVRSPDGSPFAGAKVTVEVPAAQLMARVQGQLDLPETYSAEDGSFRLTGLGEGNVSLVGTHADYASSEAVPVSIAPGAVTKDVEIRLRRGGTLTGMVYDREGKPLSGGQVILQAPTMVETNLRRTDEAGTFRFEKLRPGGWTVVAMLAEVGVAESDDDTGEEGDMSRFLENMLFSPVEIRDGEETHVVLGEPPKDPVAVTGRVTHAGKPVQRGIVSFVPEGGSGFQDMKMNQSDEDGRFEVRLNGPGRYLVSVQVTGESGVQQNSVEFSETVPEEETHWIELALPLGRISGRVFGPEGDALENARVSLFYDGAISLGSFLGGQYAEATTDGGGRYAFEFVRPGTYCVGAGGTPFGGAFGTHSEVGRSLQNGIRIGEDEAVDGIDFRLTKAGELRGTVRDASGSPVANAALFLRDEGGRLLERFSLTASATDGSFQYTGLAAGSYEVVARSKEQASATSPSVRVTEGQTSQVEVMLAQGTVLVVEVADKDGAPASASISVRDGRGREWTGMIAFTDMTDLTKGFDMSVMRIGPIPPGSYTVEARASDGRSTKKPINLDGSDAERSVKLRFK